MADRMGSTVYYSTRLYGYMKLLSVIWGSIKLNKGLYYYVSE